MTATKILDLTNVEVEHLLGLDSGQPLVKLRAEADGVVLLGQIEPSQARRIAAHLAEAAARAEYEHDLYTAATTAGLEAGVIGFIFRLVRSGELKRHTGFAS